MYTQHSFSLHPEDLTEKCQSFPSKVSLIQMTNMEHLQHRLTLLKKLLQEEEQYIAKLKIILLRIKLPFQQEFQVDEDTIKYLFGNYENMKSLHEGFLNQLKNVVEQENTDEEEFAKMLRGHIQFLPATYGGLVDHSMNILSQIKGICQINNQRATQLFADFEHPLEDYILLPITYVTSYNQLFCSYAKHLPDKAHPLYKTFSFYRQILNNKLHMDLRNFYRFSQSEETNHQLIHNIHQHISALEEDSLQKSPQWEIMRKTKIRSQIQQMKSNRGSQNTQSYWQQQHMEILLSCQVFVRKGKSRLFLIRWNNQNYILALSPQNIKQFAIKINNSVQVFEFTDLIYFQNRLGISDYSQYYMVKFASNPELLAFSEKVKLLKGGATLEKAEDHFTYEARAENFAVSFKIVGQQKNQLQKRKYIIRMQCHEYHVFQHLFIQTCELNALLNHLNKALKIDFSQWQFDLLASLKANQYEILQMKWVQVENKLNYAIRHHKLREHPQYFFNKFKVYEGLWQLLTKKQKCECQECRLVLQNISSDSLFEILQSNDNNKNHWQSKVCPFFWAKINYDLQEKLNRNQFSKLNVSSKLSLIFLSENGSNWKLNKCFKKLKKPKKITIKIHNLSIKPQKLIIEQIYKQETVQILLKKVAEVLKLAFWKDFCVYRKINNDIVFYDQSQYLQDIADVELYSSFYFSKKFFFDKEIEMSLIEEKLEPELPFNPRVQLVVGEIMEKLNQSQKHISQDVMVEFVGLQAELLAKKLNFRILNNNTMGLQNHLKLFQVNIKSQILEKKILDSVQRDRSMPEIYRDLIQKYKGINFSNRTFRVLQVDTSILVNQVYKKEQAYLTVNFNSLVLEVPKLKIARVLNHSEYKIDGAGLYIRICPRGSASHDRFDLRSCLSFTISKQIKIYQKVHRLLRWRNSYKAKT